jgi:hypothetical protein
MGISVTLAFIIALTLLVSWLGGGRKWAFRTVLSLLILALLVGCGVLLYVYWTAKSAERRAQKVHECAIDKIARARCVPGDTTKTTAGVEIKWDDVCPPYMLPDNPTFVQETAAMTAAEWECKVEMNLTEKSLHEQVGEYRRQHGIKETTAAVKPQGDIFDALVKKCAAKVRKKYPGA